jgi:hypothetical protein
MYAERKNADPYAVVEHVGQATVLYADDEVVCFDVALGSNIGASVTGRITATRS